MSDTPSFLAETAADTAEFEAVRDAVETEAPAPTPAPEPKSESVAETPKPAEPAKPAEPKQEERKFVPHAALHEERLKRQAVEKELADLRAGRTPEPEKTAEIDPETDPIAALKEVRAYQQQQREQGERQQQEQAFVSRVQSHEADFAAATPDYAAAITHLREHRANEIIGIAKALNKPLTQEMLGAQLRHEALATANDALQAGMNPGEFYYKLAQARGYALKADPPPPPPKVEEPDPVVSKASNETIDRITRGQKAASIRGGGDPPDNDGELSLEAIGKLDGAAFDKAMEKFGKRQKEAESRMH